MGTIIKNLGSHESQTVYEKGLLRLHTISQIRGIGHEEGSEDLVIGVENEAICDGLGVEFQTPGGSYIVIAFIKPDKDGLCSYKSVGSRIEDNITTYELWTDFQEVVKYGFSTIETAIKERDKESYEE